MPPRWACCYWKAHWRIKYHSDEWHIICSNCGRLRTEPGKSRWIGVLFTLPLKEAARKLYILNGMCSHLVCYDNLRSHSRMHINVGMKIPRAYIIIPMLGQV